MTRVLTVSNWKGGVGKTTIAVNLGAALVREGLRVLMVDMDPQSSTTLHCGVNPFELDASVDDALIGHRDFEAIIRRHVAGELDLAPAHPDLAKAINPMLKQPDSYSILGELLHRVQGSYDYILIDTQPAMYLLTMSALAASDQVLVPVNADYFSLEGFGWFQDEVRKLRDQGITTAEILGLVVNEVEPLHADGKYRKRIMEDAISILQKSFGDLVFHTQIRKNVRLEEAPSAGRTIFEHAPRSPGAVDFSEFADEVMARCQA